MASVEVSPAVILTPQTCDIAIYPLLRILLISVSLLYLITSNVSTDTNLLEILSLILLF